MFFSYFSILSSLTVPFETPVHMLLCYASSCTEHTTTFQFYYGYFLPVSHSGHKILFLSFSNIPSTVFFLLYQLYFILTTSFSLTAFFLYLHTSRQLLHYTFLKYSPEINSCLWFSCILVFL